MKSKENVTNKEHLVKCITENVSDGHHFVFVINKTKEIKHFLEVHRHCQLASTVLYVGKNVPSVSTGFGGFENQI